MRSRMSFEISVLSGCSLVMVNMRKAVRMAANKPDCKKCEQIIME